MRLTFLIWEGEREEERGKGENFKDREKWGIVW